MSFLIFTSVSLDPGPGPGPDPGPGPGPDPSLFLPSIHPGNNSCLLSWSVCSKSALKIQSVKWICCIYQTGYCDTYIFNMSPYPPPGCSLPPFSPFTSPPSSFFVFCLFIILFSFLFFLLLSLFCFSQQIVLILVVGWFLLPPYHLYHLLLAHQEGSLRWFYNIKNAQVTSTKEVHRQT